MTVSNTESRPGELVCPPTGPGPGDAVVEVVKPRQVPLGGLRAMTVRRTLPTRGRSTIGAWCFCDHYGPEPVAETGGMTVAAHPHTGLQTVSWLFSGEIEHRDSTGAHARVRPGELNLMTAGQGIAHSEVSPDGVETLHGVQLWVALPDRDRRTAPRFERSDAVPIAGAGWRGAVFIGSLAGATASPTTATPLLGAELTLDPDAAVELEVPVDHEHGVLLDSGSVSVDDHPLAQHDLGYRSPASGTLRLAAGSDGARVLLLGGAPFTEPLVMWWNFVGRSHDEIVAARRAWQEQILSDDAIVPDARLAADGRFGVVTGDGLAPIPAPTLPNARLSPRR